MFCFNISTIGTRGEKVFFLIKTLLNISGYPQKSVGLWTIEFLCIILWHGNIRYSRHDRNVISIINRKVSSYYRLIGYPKKIAVFWFDDLLKKLILKTAIICTVGYLTDGYLHTETSKHQPTRQLFTLYSLLFLVDAHTHTQQHKQLSISRQPSSR